MNPTTNNKPLGGDDLPISVSIYGSLEECEKERARREAQPQAGAAGASDQARLLAFQEELHRQGWDVPLDAIEKLLALAGAPTATSTSETVPSAAACDTR